MYNCFIQCNLANFQNNNFVTVQLPEPGQAMLYLMHGMEGERKSLNFKAGYTKMSRLSTHQNQSNLVKKQLQCTSNRGTQSTSVINSAFLLYNYLNLAKQQGCLNLQNESAHQTYILHQNTISYIRLVIIDCC